MKEDKTIKFISKAINKHGNKYDYSHVTYINSTTKVCITCPNHGNFLQTPSAHLAGQGCPECGWQNSITKRTTLTSEFICKANKIHNNKYDYSKVIYKTKEDKICIICPTHGEFLQRAGSHIRGIGCPICGKLKASKSKIQTACKQFYTRLNEKNISIESSYINNDTKIKLRCNTCGNLWVTTPHSINNGGGCPACSKKLAIKNRTKSHDVFICELQKVNPNVQVQSTYVKDCDKIKCICTICNNTFWARPNHLLRGHGCSLCAINKHRITIDNFITRSNKTHNYKYIYDKTTFVDTSTKVIITCPIHGDFVQNPSAHMLGNGCPKCNASKGELLITSVLSKHSIDFIHQYEIIINERKYFIDFFIEQNNKKYFIEYNGKQHYTPIEYFGGELAFKKQIVRDNIIRNYCKENNIILLEIDYKISLDLIEQLLLEKFQTWGLFYLQND